MERTGQVSVAEHQKWREQIAGQQVDQCNSVADPIDDALEANPIFDRLPQRRSNKATSRLLGILDQLNKEGRK
jgi:hypothetical protein